VHARCGIAADLVCLRRSMHHPNRFVRETAHFTAATLCQALRGERLLAVGQDLAERLADGLSDNWSQVGVACHLCVCFGCVGGMFY
jgi:hypothetical protein